MKRQLRRWISILLAFSMCMLLLAGCGTVSGNGETGGNSPGKSDGKDGEKNNNSELLNKDVIYRSTPAGFDLPISEISRLILSGDTMYISGYEYDEETWASTYYIFAGNADGTQLSSIYEYSEGAEKYPDGPAIMESEPVQGAEPDQESESEQESESDQESGPEQENEPNQESDTGQEVDPEQETESIQEPEPGREIYTGEYVQNIVGDGQGNLILLFNRWTQTPEEYLSEMILVKMDRNGDELWNLTIPEVTYASHMVCGGGKILVNAESVVYVFDDQGSPLNKIELVGDMWINSMVMLADGRTYVTYYDYTNGDGKYVLKPLNLQTGALEAEIEAPWSSQGLTMIPGIGYDIFLQGSSFIAGYNIGDANYTEILNYVDSDIDVGNMSFISPSGENSFYMGAYNPDNGKLEMFSLTKVAPEDVKEKVILTLGMMWNDYQMTSEIIKFNKTNEDYRIKVVVYSDYNTSANPEAGTQQLNNDINSGKAPDILITNSYYMPLDSYISKGAFADLNELLAADPELKAEDFMPNVLDAFSVDGKLYQITPSFAVSTVVGKTALVGEGPGWTIDDVLALQAAYPDSQMFEMWTRQDLMNSCMNVVGHQFMNELEGTCSFDSEEFIKLLEWANTFPAEIDYNKVDDDYYLHYDTMYRENKTLLQSTTISAFEELKYLRGAAFGEAITCIGYPTSEGSGSVLQPETTFAISSQSENKDGAWQFIRRFLTDEYQMSDKIWCFPVKLSALEEKGEQAMKPYTYIDENGNEVVVEDTYWVGDKEIVIEPLTQEEIDKYIEFMKTVDRVSTLNTEVLNIIMEDAEHFFAGQKSAEEVAKIIQSRASIFLAENS
ncbi:MAG: extracellular solute-binding protein [Lachnospiraceae bacterium]|nr:extracellular solute-binding protein [Lachnospiraceae bacterium]